MNRSETEPYISLVIPVYNESQAIARFLARIEEVLGNYNGGWELVFINDGSGDDSLNKLVAAASSDPRLSVINLSRNFGKEAALTAGLDHASGQVVVPIDADLQDPPELIHDFLAKWREGYDVVYGVRTDRDAESLAKRTSASLFYRLFNKVSKVRIPENVGDFRLMDRRVVEVVRRLPERNRFMKGLFAWVGFTSVGVPYSRPERSAGESGMGYWRLWNLALDGIIGFTAAPLRVWAYIGAGIALLAFLYASFIVAKVLVYGVDVPGYASLMTVILFLGGIQLLLFGILGEYFGRLFDEVKGRPIYIVEGVYGGVDEARRDVAVRQQTEDS